MEKTYSVYVLANKLGGTLYIGATSDLVRMIYQHRMGWWTASRKNTELTGCSTSNNTMMSRPRSVGKSG